MGQERWALGAGTTGGTGVLVAAAALAGAALALAIQWLHLPSRSAAVQGIGEVLDGLSREEVAAFAIVLALLGAVALVLFRRSGRALAAKEAEIARMTWRLNLALEASEVGFWDVDLTTDALSWDDRACTLYGVSPRDGYFSEEDWVAAIHPDDRARAVATANHAVANGERFVSDYRVLQPDGQLRHLRDVAAFYIAPDGTRRLSGLVWDVSADKAREEELELRRREAEAANVAKSNFLAVMSHEIRTPLAGVIGMLDLMLDEALPPKQAERARVASTSAHSLLQILNEILEFSKLQADAIALCPVPVRPREVVCEVTALMAAHARQKNVALTCAVSDRVPEWASLDPVRLRQVLTNIVSNAIAFTEAGRVAVRVDYSPAEDGRLTVEVEDTGVGIPDADRDRIFERFVQADGSSSRGAGGTGLGLAIARQLVELMGGTIAVDSAEGHGSTFRFTVRVGSAAPQPAPAPPEAVPAPPPLRILVAEDNPTNQYLIEALLAAGGHDVTVVPDGPAAVRAVREGGFDVVLMDVQMPGMDGVAAARAIRDLPGPDSGIPIIALTASVQPGEAERYRAAGMTDHVGKPIDRAALARALARAAGWRGGPAAVRRLDRAGREPSCRRVISG